MRGSRGGRGQRGSGRAQPRRAGRFTRGPVDPPPSFKSGWKNIILGIGLGSTTITLNTGTIRDSLVALGITANSIKLLKVAVWVTPGTAANATKLEVIMAVKCPIGQGSLGTREDTGLLSSSATVSYSYSDTVRETAFDLPAAGQSGISLAAIDASQATGTIQVSLAYSI